MIKVKTSIIATIFLLVLIASLSMTHWDYGQEGTQTSFQPAQEGVRAPESGIGEVGIELFTVYVFPFEVLSLVLLAALIGAIYIARKETV